MYFRAQVLNSETGQTVCAVIANAHLVTAATLQKWAQGVAQNADAIAGRAGLHTVESTENLATAAAALTRVKGMGAGGGNHGAKPKGRCAVCGRVYPVNRHGVLSKHGKQYQKRDGSARNPKTRHCAGSGTKPKTVV